MTRVVGMSFNHNEVYECGAQLLTLLAYPDPKEKERHFNMVHACLCARALRRAYAPPNDITAVPMKPWYAFQEVKTIDKWVKAVDRGFQDRLVAGRMAVPFLVEVETGMPPKLPPDVARLSLNEMASLVLDESGQADPGNVETRIWRASRRVIHIATAATVVRQEYLKSGVSVGLDHMLENRELIESVVRRSELLAPLVVAASKLRIKAEDLVEIRLA